MNIRQFADDRGVSRAAVRHAIRRGRLARSVRRDDKGRVDIDPAEGAREWEGNRQRLPTTGAPDAGRTELSRASAEEKVWRAKLAKLAYEEKASELVEAREVEAKIGAVLEACRERLLRIPADFGRHCPHLPQADVDVIEALVREALEALTWKEEE